MHQRRRRMESGIYHQPRPIRTQSHVLQSYQLSSHIPNNDERHICGRTTQKLANNLHG